MKKADFDFLLELLNKNAGWDFDEENYFVIDKKISNFVREKGYSSVEDLIAELRVGQKAIVSQVVESIALSDTCFYRDYDVFARFENFVLPHIREANRSAKKLRIWSLGCASGQETYSIAMAIKQKLIGISDWNVDIIGTDLSSASIAKAQRGVYSSFEVQMGLNIETIINNFHQEKDNWKVNDDIMKMVEFRRYNLLDQIGFASKFEIIFCRNVLRFFTPVLQRQIIEKIYKQQTLGGFLYLGKEENLEGLSDFYGKVPGFTCLYQAKNVQNDNAKLYYGEESKQSSKEDAMPSFMRPNNIPPSIR